MGIEEMKNQSFLNYHHDDWKQKAEESLKGKSIDSLQTATYENILLKPLYSSEDEEFISEYPGGSDFRRGLHSFGNVINKWKIAQKINYKTQEELAENLKQAMERGQTALSFELSEVMNEKLLDLIVGLYKKFPFAINAKGNFQLILEQILRQPEIESSSVKGYIGFDPLSSFVMNGNIPNEKEKYLKEWSQTIIKYTKSLPNLRTILINTSVFHNGGANAVQELGIAVASGVFYLQELLEKGLEVNEAASKMIFQFSIGSNFFMEIAKIRAARILWNKITEVYGVKMEMRGMHISAETSLFTKTLYDKHVNILRAGNEAFAAVLGGVQYLHVAPFDESAHFSERLARNTQLILQEEAQLQHIVDPAGGSWYIEALTRELAEKAWGFFQAIEAREGLWEVMKSGWLQKEIFAVFEKRKNDTFTRKESIIGTNVYAKLDETVIVHDVLQEASPESLNLFKIERIPQLRLSEPYENLRKRAGKLMKKPEVGLICLGNIKDYKARADFMKGFLAAGGIKGVEKSFISSDDSAKDFVASSGTKHFCLCSSNELYETLGHEILKTLVAEFPGVHFYLAGLPTKDQQTNWVTEGIQQFIHIKSNCYETLESILFQMEVSQNEA